MQNLTTMNASELQKILRKYEPKDCIYCGGSGYLYRDVTNRAGQSWQSRKECECQAELRADHAREVEKESRLERAGKNE